MLKYILKVQECDATIAETCTAAGYTKNLSSLFFVYKKQSLLRQIVFFNLSKLWFYPE